MRALRSRRSPIACVLLLLYLPACYSWHTGTPTPAQFVETEHPQSVRVTLTDSRIDCGRSVSTSTNWWEGGGAPTPTSPCHESTYQLRNPVVRGDSLVGLVGGSRDTTRTGGYALSDISRVEVKKLSAGKTVALVLVEAVVVVGIIAGAVAFGDAMEMGM